MKKLIFSLTVLSLSACTMSQKTNDDDSQSVTSNITFSKHMKTGLCFGMVTFTKSGGFNSVSVTCVPCDSLKKVKVVEVN